MKSAGVDLALDSRRHGGALLELVADRFWWTIGGVAIDLSSGDRVELIMSTAGGVSNRRDGRAMRSIGAICITGGSRALVDYGSVRRSTAIRSVEDRRCMARLLAGARACDRLRERVFQCRRVESRSVEQRPGSTRAWACRRCAGCDGWIRSQKADGAGKESSSRRLGSRRHDDCAPVGGGDRRDVSRRERRFAI